MYKLVQFRFKAHQDVKKNRVISANEMTQYFNKF